MKVPKTFIPEKNLESKTEELFTPKESESPSLIDPEAEKLFPNFVNYLKKECDSVHIRKGANKDKKNWVIFDQEKTGVFVLKGFIREHIEKEGEVSSYGYKARVKVGKRRLELFYRIGCQFYNHEKGLVSTECPVRYDVHEIPFP